jgi:hypothetical protein
MFLRLLLVAGGGVFSLVASPTISPDGLDFFERKIRPVLVENCYQCHSAEAEKIKGGLLLDTREGLLKGGESGVAIVPGQPEQSRLLRAVKFLSKDLQMPPKQKLEPHAIADLEAWIKMGAPDPREGKLVAVPAPAAPPMDFTTARKFWSFQSVKDPPPPRTRSASTTLGPVDLFIAAKLEEKGLVPNSPADKRTLIRRATYDLTGLPPTPEEVRAFLADESSVAFAKVVDRLLASPHYGEQWGRHWLDVIRYADTSGCSADFPIPAAYRYRNYVIDSFNRDKPYDRFVREQIAGDLLPTQSEPERLEGLIATGYLALARRFGNRPDEFHLTIEDAIDNLGKATLGLSLGCARCHDHKFDPLPATDYYALYGIFSSTRFAFPGTGDFRRPKDFAPLAAPNESAAQVKVMREIAALDDLIFQLQEEKKALERSEKVLSKVGSDGASRPASQHDDPESRTNALAENKTKTDAARVRLKLLEASLPTMELAYAVTEGTPANARLHRKGDPKSPGVEVPRGFLVILGGQRLPESATGSGRRELTDWLTSRDNPLFARVMVNRIWQHHFGRGLVASPNDFGVRGRAPSHPELLDYLASRFIASAYSVKALHKLLMLTNTYQRSSAENSLCAALDADNELLWRFNRRRLSAEEIRDSMLILSGALDRTMAQAHPFPVEADWKYTEHKPYLAVYETAHRSVYLMQQRIKKHPFLQVFDGADPNASTAGRPLSTTPLQALFLMNDPFIHDQSLKLANRIALASANDVGHIRQAFELAFARPATDKEITWAEQFLTEARADLAKLNPPSDHVSHEALAGFARVLLSSNELLYVD